VTIFIGVYLYRIWLNQACLRKHWIYQRCNQKP